MSALNSNSIQCNLHVFDFNEGDATVLKLLDINSSEIHLKGDIRQVKSNNIVHTETVVRRNVWTLSSGLSDDKSIEEHIESVLEKIRPLENALKLISTKYEVELSVGAYFYEANPGLRIDSSVIHRLSNLNIVLDFDFYCLAD